MWEHPDADCMGPVGLAMGELGGEHRPLFPRVSPWWEVGLMEGLELRSRELRAPMFSGRHYTIRNELSPKVLERKPWGHVQAGSVPSKHVLSPAGLKWVPSAGWGMSTGTVPACKSEL